MIHRGHIYLSVIIFSAALSSCGKDVALFVPEKEIMHIPEGFPEMEFPEDNVFTIERWELGKALFYDPILSASGKVSCGSCHKADIAFSDNVAFSSGDEGRIGRSNAPSLANIGYHPYFTRAGGVPTLEMQVQVPIQEHDEFNNNILFIAEAIKDDLNYKKYAQLAYSREPDPYVIIRAIACFERSFISGNSSYDKFINGANEHDFGISEIRGKELFFSSKTQCSSCHSGFNFTNYGFENNGLFSQYVDQGRARFTQNNADIGKFKVPSLRDIELTSPYMHDGSLVSLEEVIEHYNSGGNDHINKSELIRPLNLSSQEKTDLVAFLKTLTDLEFVNNKRFRR
ncbi:MAG: cytochrome c peroxidase [Bacteroidia bacterium]